VGKTIAHERPPNWDRICAGCGECCGPVPVTRGFWRRHKRDALAPFRRRRVGPHVVAYHPDATCAFLTPSKRCAVYSDRPLVCRLYGTIPELPCLRMEPTRARQLCEARLRALDRKRGRPRDGRKGQERPAFLRGRSKRPARLT